MAGPTGSTLTVTTGNGVTCIVTRDVSAEEANATTVDSIRKAAETDPNQKRQLTPMECQRFGVPIGSYWGSSSKSAAKSSQAKPAAKPAAKPVAKPAARPAEQGRLLSHMEC